MKNVKGKGRVAAKQLPESDMEMSDDDVVMPEAPGEGKCHSFLVVSAQFVTIDHTSLMIDEVLEDDEQVAQSPTGSGSYIVHHQDKQELPLVCEDEETEVQFKNEGVNLGMYFLLFCGSL